MTPSGCWMRFSKSGVQSPNQAELSKPLLCLPAEAYIVRSRPARATSQHMGESAGEMASQLRAQASLPEHWVQLPAPSRRLMTICNSSPRGFRLLTLAGNVYLQYTDIHAGKCICIKGTLQMAEDDMELCLSPFTASKI